MCADACAGEKKLFYKALKGTPTKFFSTVTQRLISALYIPKIFAFYIVQQNILKTFGNNSLTKSIKSTGSAFASEKELCFLYFTPEVIQNTFF